MRQFLRVLCAAAVAAAPGATPPLGWSSWCTEGSCGQPHRSGNEHDVCSEGEVKAVATAMATNGMQAAGYTLLSLDDCWGAVQRAPGGDFGRLAADTHRFPSGNGTMAELASWLHARGFQLGLYLAAGNETCSTGGRAVPGEPHARGISGSCAAGPVPDAASCRSQYEQDAADVASWGVDMVKLDWCGFNGSVGEGGVAGLTTAFGAALAKTKRPIFYNFHCEASWAPWCPAAGVGSAAGVSWRVSKDHHDTWASTSAIIDVLGTVANRTAPRAYSDPDFLMTGGAGCDIGAAADDDAWHPPPADDDDDPTPYAGLRCPGQTEVEYRTEFSLWAVAAAPLVVATDLRLLTPFMAATLMHEELLAVSQDARVRPRGVVQAKPCGGGSCQVWARDLVPRADGGAAVAVALYNGGNAAATIAVPLALLFAGAPHGMSRALLVRDAWQRHDLGRFAGNASLSAAVASHATEVFVVRQDMGPS